MPEFPPGSGDPQELTLQVLADLLAIDKSRIVVESSARRATVYLLIYVSSGEISRVSMALTDTVRLAAGLSAQLAARHNIQVAITVSSPSEVQDSASGVKDVGIWEEVDGQYMLRYD